MAPVIAQISPASQGEGQLLKHPLTFGVAQRGWEEMWGRAKLATWRLSNRFMISSMNCPIILRCLSKSARRCGWITPSARQWRTCAMVALTARRISWRECRSDGRAKVPRNLHAKRVEWPRGNRRLLDRVRWTRARRAIRARPPVRSDPPTKRSRHRPRWTLSSAHRLPADTRASGLQTLVSHPLPDKRSGRRCRSAALLA